jgi:hypothetical protein
MQGRLAKFIVVVLMVCSVDACTSKQDRRLDDLDKKVAIIEADLKTLRSDHDFLKGSFGVVEGEVTELESQTPDTSASFAPDQKGFQPIHTAYGVFLVSLADIKQYASGYKATFNLGNPFSVSYQGAEIEVRWGPKRPDDFKTLKYVDWLKQFKTSKQKIPNQIKGGSWNPIEVILAPATPSEIGQIDVTSITTSSVSLAVR